MKRLLTAFAFVMCMASSPARAGIPVIDVASLIQAVQEVINSITQIQNQINQIQQLSDQIQQMDTQLNSINGIRGLVNVANNPLLRDYVPAGAPQVLQGISTNGYVGLQGAARASRDAQMVYNCMDVGDLGVRRDCQARLARPYQERQFFTDALQRSSQRMAQITQLQQSASTAADPKAQSEAQARIGLEQAMLTHELTQVQLLANQTLAEERVRQSRAMEAAQEQAARRGRMADIFN